MHLGRFNAAIGELSEYFKKLELEPKLAEAIAKLQQYNSSRDQTVLVEFRTLLREVAARAEVVPSSFLLPSVVEILADMHVDEWVGIQLANRIRAVHEVQGLFSDEIVASLGKLRDEFVKVWADIAALDAALVGREVESEELTAGEAEFGIAFPRELVGETAYDLVTELSHINRLFMALNEFMGRGTESPRVRTIASSAWQFFLQLDAAQIALWTIALERIVSLLKNNYEIKKLQKELTDKGDIVPPHFVTELETKLLTNLKAGVTELAAELRAACTPAHGQSVADLNELEVKLKQELLHLVRRVNGGAVVELRLGVPSADVPNPESTEGAPSALVGHGSLKQEVLQQNSKLAELSSLTASLDLRADLLLESAQADENINP